ncbi:hypothetical protein CVT26_000074, partial [Gymnopilus dilepis]
CVFCDFTWAGRRRSRLSCQGEPPPLLRSKSPSLTTRNCSAGLELVRSCIVQPNAHGHQFCFPYLRRPECHSTYTFQAVNNRLSTTTGFRQHRCDLVATFPQHRCHFLKTWTRLFRCAWTLAVRCVHELFLAAFEATRELKVVYSLQVGLPASLASLLAASIFLFDLLCNCFAPVLQRPTRLVRKTSARFSRSLKSLNSDSEPYDERHRCPSDERHRCPSIQILAICCFSLHLLHGFWKKLECPSAAQPCLRIVEAAEAPRTTFNEARHS